MPYTKFAFHSENKNDFCFCGISNSKLLVWSVLVRQSKRIEIVNVNEELGNQGPDPLVAFVAINIVGWFEVEVGGELRMHIHKNFPSLT